MDDRCVQLILSTAMSDRLHHPVSRGAIHAVVDEESLLSDSADWTASKVELIVKELYRIQPSGPSSALTGFGAARGLHILGLTISLV
jgi:hypothetical protein